MSNFFNDATEFSPTHEIDRDRMEIVKYKPKFKDYPINNLFLRF